MRRVIFRREPSPVGAILRRLRVERGLSQVRLALAAGVSQRHLGFVEIGRAQPGTELLATLADVLRASPTDRNALFLAAGYAPPGGAPSDPVWFQRVIDSSPLAIFAADRSLRIVLVNASHVQLMGAPDAQSILGKDLRRDQIWRFPRARGAIADCLAGGEHFSFDVWGTTRHGRVFCARGELSPLLDGGDRIIGIQSAMRDIPLGDRNPERLSLECVEPAGTPAERRRAI